MNAVAWLGLGIAVGAYGSFYFWRMCLMKMVGEVLEKKRDWRIGGRIFDIVERK